MINAYEIPVILSDLNETCIFLTDIKLNENPASRCRAVACRRTGMTRLIVAFHKFLNEPKNVACARKLC